MFLRALLPEIKVSVDPFCAVSVMELRQCEISVEGAMKLSGV